MYDSHHDKQVDDRDSDEEDKSSSAGSAGGEGEESKPQSGYFHVVASFILIIHGFTFLVPPDSEAEDTDMMRTIGKWLGFEWDWMRHFTPYAQVCSTGSTYSQHNNYMRLIIQKGRQFSGGRGGGYYR